jgi:hypothetical protein
MREEKNEGTKKEQYIIKVSNKINCIFNNKEK